MINSNVQNKIIRALVFYIVIMLAVFTGLLVASETLSKFADTSSGNSGDVTVAKPVCIVTPLNTDVGFELANDGFYCFSVANASSGNVTETTLTYTVVVTVTSSSNVVPVKLIRTNSAFLVESANYTPSVNGSVYTFSNGSAMTFSISAAETHYYKLKLQASAVGDCQITVDVVATQVN